jgi:hypothetical protein
MKCESCGQAMWFPESRVDKRCGGCRPDPEQFALDAKIYVHVIAEDEITVSRQDWDGDDESWRRAVELVQEDFDFRRDNWAEWSRLRRELEKYVAIDYDPNYSFQVVEPKPQRSVA